MAANGDFAEMGKIDGLIKNIDWLCDQLNEKGIESFCTLFITAKSLEVQTIIDGKKVNKAFEINNADHIYNLTILRNEMWQELILAKMKFSAVGSE